MWTDERIEKLKELWVAGMSGTNIGFELGVTRGAVLGKIFRLGMLGSRDPIIRAAKPTDWSKENTERLLEIYARTKCTKQCADELGFTRNAVCSKLTRLGVDRGGSARRKTGIDGAMASRFKQFIHKNKQTKQFAEPPKPKEFLGITFENLGPDQCRYPRGDAPFLFCGQPKMEGSSYCAYCHSLCWVSPRARQEGKNITRLNSAAIIKLRGTIDPLAVDANISEIEAA